MITDLFRIGDEQTDRVLRRYLASTVIAALCVAAAVGCLIPLADAMFSSRSSSTILSWAAAVAASAAVAAVLDWRGTLVAQDLSGRYIERMHALIADRVLRLPLGWFDTDRSGRLGRTVSFGVMFAANAVETMIRPVLQTLVLTAAVAGVLGVVDWPSGLCVLAAAAAVLGVFVWAHRRNHAAETRVDAANAEAASRVLEFARAQAVIRAAGPDSLGERATRAALADQRAAIAAAGRGRGATQTALSATVAAGTALTLIVATLRATSGALGYGSFVGSVAVVVITAGVVLRTLPFGTGLELARATFAQITALTATETLAEPDVDRRVGREAPHVELNDVRFSYPGGPRVLDGVELHVPAGTTTAIVGPSGSGKTTLAHLVARFHDVDHGAVRIGGVDVRDLGTDRVLESVSMVFQDVYLFDDTLWTNIAVGRPDASAEEIRAAGRTAGVDRIAARLADGYDTHVGEAGGALSSGERQRVSIARALLKDAPVVLLDEALSALDVESAAYVAHGIAELGRSRTVILIAHQPQTVRTADQVAFLDGGGIAAVGRHDELMDSSPEYRTFWRNRDAPGRWLRSPTRGIETSGSSQHGPRPD
nr:ABC transporter ATP-binding protein [Gordonia humi]